MLKWRGFKLALAAFVVATGAILLHPQQTQAAPQQQHHTGPERGSEQLPFAVEAHPQPKTKAELAQVNAEKDAKAATDAKLVDLTGNLALYTGLLFVATVVLALATGALVVVGFLQVRDAKTSIAATAKAAAAAEKSATTAEKTLNNLEGPIIRPHDMVFRHDEKTGEVAICFKNFGRSPSVVSNVSVVLMATVANNPTNILDNRNRSIIFEEIIAPTELSEILIFADDILRQHGNNIDAAITDLHLMLSYTWDSLLGIKHSDTERFIWSPKRRRFLSSIQLWDDPERFPPSKIRRP